MQLKKTESQVVRFNSLAWFLGKLPGLPTGLAKGPWMPRSFRPRKHCVTDPISVPPPHSGLRYGSRNGKLRVDAQDHEPSSQEFAPVFVDA